MSKRKYRFGNEWRWQYVICEDYECSWNERILTYGVSFDCEQYKSEDGWECYHEYCVYHARKYNKDYLVKGDK